MSEFKISQTQYRKFRRMFLLISIPISVLIVAGILLMDLLHAAGLRPIDLIFRLIYPVLLAVVFVNVIYRSLRDNHRWMTSYCLTISQGGISEQSKDVLKLIGPTEIREIRKRRIGGFEISGQPKKIGGQITTIAIPRWVDDMGKVEEQLRALGPITTNSKADRTDLLQTIFLLAAFVLFLCLFYSPNKFAQVTIGLSIVAFFGLWLLFFRTVIKNPGPSEKMFRGIIRFLMITSLILTAVKFFLF